MKKESSIIIILSILLLFTNVAWINHNFQIQQPTNGWIEVLSWDSETYHRTITFRITGEEWYIAWGFAGYVQGTRCNVTVYDAYNDKVVKTLSFTNDDNKSYFNLTGRFYLIINVYGSVKDWSIHVSEYR